MPLKSNKKQPSNKNGKKFNYNKLKKIAGTINWADISLISDPNQALNNLIKKFKHV